MPFQIEDKRHSVPSDMMLVSLNGAVAYHHRSENCFEEIHKAYFGAASRNNDGFVAGGYEGKRSLAIEKNAIAIRRILQGKRFLPIRIDEDCIAGRGECHYRGNPLDSKGNFIGGNAGKAKIIGEIREPRRFKGLILPYKGSADERFKRDFLNHCLVRKRLTGRDRKRSILKAQDFLNRSATAKVKVEIHVRGKHVRRIIKKPGHAIRSGKHVLAR